MINFGIITEKIETFVKSGDNHSNTLFKGGRWKWIEMIFDVGLKVFIGLKMLPFKPRLQFRKKMDVAGFEVRIILLFSKDYPRLL